MSHEEFKKASEDIRVYMLELHNSNELPSDKQIFILGQKFYERDRKEQFDLEMMHVIRGFQWGMSAMRQIIEGNDLEPNPSSSPAA